MMLTGVDDHRARDFFDKAAIIKIAFRIFEIPLKKLLVPSFRQDVEAQNASIQFHIGIPGAGHRHTRLIKDLATKLIGDAAWVLHRIVERDFLQTMKSLTLGQLMEIQS